MVSSEGTRPPVHSPEFKPYFEGVIKSSKGLLEAMERMGYGGPSSVRYHMKKLGIEDPDHWYVRPPAWSPKFASYFEEIVRTSKTRGEAVNRLGYANPSVIDYHLKKFGIKRPAQWKLKPGVSRQRRGRVPDVILKTSDERAWVGALTQGEGCIRTHYSKKFDTTSLELAVAMTDSAPVFKFCDLVGTTKPRRPAPRASPRKPTWRCAIGGLRAYRVLQEILPFLVGQKLDEAKRALEFFSPDGYRSGRHGGYDVWPVSEYPLRKRGVGMYRASLRARFADSNEDFSVPDEEQIPTPEMDRSCIRIAEALLNALPSGRGLVEIMDDTGLAWRTVIHHLKHLDQNRLVTREKVHQRLGGPKWSYRPSPKLAEIRDAGWTFST